MGWFRDLFRKTDSTAIPSTLSDQYTTIAIRELAFEMCVTRIARAISKCEFRTYSNRKEVKEYLYYTLNIAPNSNENHTQFINKLIHKLYYEGEALIIPRRTATGSNLYIADSYTVKTEMTFREHTFEGIQIGEYKDNRVYKASDVFYIKLDNNRIKLLLENTTSMYADLIQASTKAYKTATAQKYKIKVARQREKDDDTLQGILDNDMKTFLKDSSVVIPEYDGYDLQKVDTGTTTANTRDIKALFDDIIDITSKAFLIPTNIMTGQVTDTSKAVDDFLTFCIDSLVRLIEDELNKKLFEPDEYLQGNRIRIDTQGIRHIDIITIATNIDKLISSGFRTINDLNRMTGDELIDEDWANEHWMTKNYSTAKEALRETSL